MQWSWYAVHSQSQKEALADLNLRRQHFRTFFPHTSDWTASTKSKRLSELAKTAYLSRYLFVAMTGAAHENFCTINDTIGVSTVVYVGGEPFPIPPEVMQGIFSLCKPCGEVYRNKPPKSKFEGMAGDLIRLGEKSPLFGFLAQVTRVLDDKVLARLQQKLFGEIGREIEVPISEIDEILRKEAVNE